jgi:hypothetical protein
MPHSKTTPVRGAVMCCSISIICMMHTLCTNSKEQDQHETKQGQGGHCKDRGLRTRDTASTKVTGPELQAVTATPCCRRHLIKV